MKKTFNLGKIDYLNNGKKNCPVEIDLDFDDKRLSICGTVWNHIKSDCYTAGQCLDDLKEYFPNDKIFNEIYLLWKKYHLNDMQAGSPAQMQYLDSLTATPDNLESTNLYKSYDWTCEQLKQADLLDDKSYFYNGKPYRYGSAWLSKIVPDEVKQQIKDLINN